MAHRWALQEISTSCLTCVISFRHRKPNRLERIYDVCVAVVTRCVKALKLRISLLSLGAGGSLFFARPANTVERRHTPPGKTSGDRTAPSAVHAFALGQDCPVVKNKYIILPFGVCIVSFGTALTYLGHTANFYNR